jgi:hypothetical protein
MYPFAPVRRGAILAAVARTARHRKTLLKRPTFVHFFKALGARRFRVENRLDESFAHRRQVGRAARAERREASGI